MTEKTLPIRERYFHGDLYSKDRNVDNRGLRIVINTHVNTDNSQSSASVDVQQLNRELKAESSALVHGLDAKQLRDLGLLFIEAANCMKYDVSAASSNTAHRMMELFKGAMGPKE